MLFLYNAGMLGSAILWRRHVNLLKSAYAGAWGTDGAGRKQE